MTDSCHDSSSTVRAPSGSTRIALIGSPNAGKTSVFNHLTGMRARTGNYPGVTVTRRVGTGRYKGTSGTTQFTVEDLPGAYSLHPISPDEQVVADLLRGDLLGVEVPDAVAVVVDVTALERSLSLIAQVLALGKPTMVVLTMTDELAARGGRLDIARLSEALGVPVVGVIGSKGKGFGALRALFADPGSWSTVPMPPPLDDDEFNAWVGSILATCRYLSPAADTRTARIDRVLLHPLWGTLAFLAVMFCFFQVVFTVAAPFQDGLEMFFGWLGGIVDDNIGNPVLSGLIGSGVIGGVGSVLVFIPQIVLMFLLISLLENVGYMSRAAFLVDRLMATTGLEGRAFVAMLSSLACAVPGIMATRTMPSSRDRIATIMAAPLMTCSARLPVYILLIGLLVDSDSHWGPLSLQGTTMFALYLFGGFAAMTAAWVFKRSVLRSDMLPFFMEMPPYRFPSPKSVFMTMWDSAKVFLRKAGTIILTASIALWFMLNLPMRTAETASMSESAAAAYVLDHSFAASIGTWIEPLFAPLGFDWRIAVGLIGALAAREVFVSTLGQIFAAQNPEDPTIALQNAVYTSGPHEGLPVFTTPTIVALLVFFVFALLCMSTLATIRRETASWKWPAVAFGYMFALAWACAFAARHLTIWITGVGS
ncbi:MAG: ferrous iron transporter B [Rhodococcus sp. (in: high G+C Gram-positive bacteria)]|uniref:ferrous iron transporter B n=1 Tax=Rhodococcus sp. TaxID=1831 RepID=UPI003BB01385